MRANIYFSIEQLPLKAVALFFRIWGLEFASRIIEEVSLATIDGLAGKISSSMLVRHEDSALANATCKPDADPYIRIKYKSGFRWILITVQRYKGSYMIVIVGHVPNAGYDAANRVLHL